jgi:prevent-host-death family protein
MIVNIRVAKAQLSKLIARAEAGEEVIIARASKPVARLMPMSTEAFEEQEKAGDLPSWMDSMRGQIKFHPGWDEPDEELIKQMEDGPIFPDEG